MVTDRPLTPFPVECSFCQKMTYSPCRRDDFHYCGNRDAATETTSPATKVKSDGGSTGYYAIPEGAKELLDLIEHKKMGFALGNIFKACYRLGEKEGTDLEYDLNKIIFFAERMKKTITKGT